MSVEGQFAEHALGVFFFEKDRYQIMEFKHRRAMVAIIIIVMVIAGSILTSCGTSDSTGDQYTASTKPKLEVWTFFDMNTPDSYYVDLWKTLGDKYGYDIDVKTYSTGQITEKLKVALVCNELPDIFLVWGGSYPDFLFDNGACIPVQQYLKSSGADFKASYIKKYKDGNNYIIPCLVEAYAVTYYNKKLMKEIGLTVPQTWSDLEKMIKKVNAYNEANNTDYAAIELGDKDSWLGELLYCMIVNRLDPKAFDKLKDGKISFDNKVFKEAAKKVRELVGQDAFPSDFLETGETEAVENFINGEAVMFPHQSTIVYYLMKNMGKDMFSVGQFPSCSSKYDSDYSEYMMDINHTLTPGLCISSQTKYQKEAAEICIDFAKQVNDINVTQYGYLNMTQKELNPPSALPDPVNQFRSLVQNAKKFTAYWYALLPQQNGSDWRNLTKKLYAGETGIPDFLKEGQDYLKFEN